ncbi:hypothetical protein K438DRAFT_2013843 [Mycena galopus ATCC 62051]|nr:hypothetical protein K438DRAFT_2013843 [Mycena galopus ATCC 62051]
MEFFFTHVNGSTPAPIWTTRGDKQWCSVGGLPIDIPEDVNDYALQPNHERYKRVLLAEGAEDYAAYFHPGMHWLGWSSNIPLDLSSEADSIWRDPAEFAFSHEEVDFLESWIDPTELGRSESEYGDARGAFVGYHLPDYWCNVASRLSERLRSVSEILAASTEWYRLNSQHGSLAILPVAVDDGTMRSLQSSRKEAERRVRGVRLIVRSQLGWLSWFTAVNHVWDHSLDAKDVEFVNLLKLPLRSKRGILFNLSRDYHEVNLRFLLANSVPFHYAWTDAEEKTGRFLRCSPQYLSEYEELASRGPVYFTGLPSFHLWKEDLERYDRYFQDSRSGRIGFIVTGYQPHWDYRMIDYVYYGARPIDSRTERRACAGRFKGRLVTTKFEDGTSQTTCTFFRQNPIQGAIAIEDLRMPTHHQYRLSDFGLETGSIEKDKYSYFYEDPSIVREQWRTRCAPRPDRSFNTFSGREDTKSAAIPPGPSGGRRVTSGPGQGSSLARGSGAPPSDRGALVPMSPTRRSSRSDDAGVTSRWARDSLPASGARRRDSRSISPRDQEGWRNRRGRRERSPPSPERNFRQGGGSRRSLSLSSQSSRSYSSPFEEEYHSASGFIDTDDVLGPEPLTREAAVEKLSRWATTVLDLSQLDTSEQEPIWNLDWLRCSKIMSDHPQSMLLLKCAAAIGNFPDVTYMLNAAIKHGIPFRIFVLQENVRNVWIADVMTTMEARSLRAMYAPGYTEIPLDYGTGGAACYARYLRQVEELLRRPHAPALVALGGAASFIALAYDENLADRFRQGPSLQTSRFGGGEVRLEVYNGVESLYTAEQISDSEISVLCGHISRGNHQTDAYLWPLPRWIHEISEHWTGGWSTVFHSFMENLRVSIMDRRNYRWRSEREWRSYIRNGNRGAFMSDVVKEAVFEEGNRLMKESFPLDWEGAALADLVLPEMYNPSTARD